MASPQAERRLAAILAAGVVDYGRLAGSNNEKALARLRLLRQRVIDPTVGAHRGRKVVSTGDRLLAAFSSTVDAVHCALVIQRAVDEHETEIVFRIGINVGDVVPGPNGELKGDGVDIAIRLESIAEPGGISLSRTAYDQVREKLDLAVRDEGPRLLRNMTEPVHVFAIDRSNSAHSMRQFGGRVLRAALAGAVAIAAIVASVFWLTQ